MQSMHRSMEKRETEKGRKKERQKEKEGERDQHSQPKSCQGYLLVPGCQEQQGPLFLRSYIEGELGMF